MGRGLEQDDYLIPFYRGNLFHQISATQMYLCAGSKNTPEKVLTAGNWRCDECVTTTVSQMVVELTSCMTAKLQRPVVLKDCSCIVSKS